MGGSAGRSGRSPYEEEACHTRLTAIQAQLVEHHRQRAVLEHELELFKQMEQQASQVAPDAVASLQKALEELVDRRGELRWRLEEIRRALKEVEDVNRSGGQERIRLDPFVEAFHRILLEAESRIAVLRGGRDLRHLLATRHRVFTACPPLCGVAAAP